MTIQFSDIADVVGVIAAGVAIWQAFQAKRAASEAVRMRDEIVSNQEMTGLARMQQICRKAIDSLKKYGPAATTRSLSGIDPERDAADVQDLLAFVQEHATILKGKTGVEFCKTMQPLLQTFANSLSERDLQKHGLAVYQQLQNFLPYLTDTVESRENKGDRLKTVR